MEYIIGALGFVLLCVFGWTKVKGFTINKKVDNALDKDKTDTKQFDKDTKVIVEKEHVVEVKEAQIDQQIVDLKDAKVDESDIANFIDAMEKKANEKN